jgi:hypothetical protein
VAVGGGRGSGAGVEGRGTRRERTGRSSSSVAPETAARQVSGGPKSQHQSAAASSAPVSSLPSAACRASPAACRARAGGGGRSYNPHHFL